MANVLDYDHEICEFEFQPRNNIHFRTNTLRKGMKLSYPSSYGLNSITAVLEGWLWYYITHGGWYAIKQRNKQISFCF